MAVMPSPANSSFMHISRLPLLLGLVATAWSCNTKPPVTQAIQHEQQPLIELGSAMFSSEDFQDSFLKNRFGIDSTKGLSPQEYIPIYTDLKRKVLSAKLEGRDTTTAYGEEIASYRAQLAKNFLVDKSLVEKLSQEAYNRMRQELRVSHILVPVGEDASPEDTLLAYRATVALRGRLEEGADFSDLAKKFSKDPTAVRNGGDLGYNTVFQTLYPFETAMYNLPVGKNSQPVRTKAGYHIIKVSDRRANRGSVRIAHVMTRIDSKSSEIDKKAAKEHIDEAYQKLQDGASWSEIVAKYSEDRESAKNQGLLSIFSVGQMVSEIENAAFSLSKINNYSKPVLSPYGWHIIKLVEKRPLESFATAAPSIRQKVVTESRAKVIEQTLVKRLKERLAVREFADQWALIAPLADSSLLVGKWDYIKPVNADWGSHVLFSIEKNEYDALSFLQYVRKRQQLRPNDTSPAVLFRRHYQEFLGEKLVQYEKEHLEESSPEFRSIMNEIRDGVLVSQMMEEMVWQKSMEDSLGQRRLYDANPGRYSYPERARAMIVTAADTQTLARIRRTLTKSPFVLESKLDDVVFGEGISELSASQIRQLDDLYIIMEKNPDYVVEVAGYRLPKEPEALSGSRIRNVVKYLTSKRISIVRIIEKDYGSFRQVPEPEKNRRISFQFLSRSAKDVEKAYNSQTPNSVSIEEGYFTQNHPLMKRAKWTAGEQTTTSDDDFLWINIISIESARGKTFAEARGAVINEYQKELEKQWLLRLRQQFPAKVNEQELEKIKR
jgi:peptidyl-prolyl cis-trans isomerase SurA